MREYNNWSDIGSVYKIDGGEYIVVSKHGDINRYDSYHDIVDKFSKYYNIDNIVESIEERESRLLKEKSIKRDNLIDEVLR